MEGYSYRPIDKRENYVKRCVAVAGDTLEIINRKLYVNGKYNDVGENVNFFYNVTFNRGLTEKDFNDFKELYGFNLGQYKDLRNPRSPRNLPIDENVLMNMSEKVKNELLQNLKKGIHGNLRLLNDSAVEPVINKKPSLNNYSDLIASYTGIYPNHPKFNWTRDNYGPLWMPKEGVSIPLNEENWIKYNRCINTYEKHNYRWEKGAVYDENNNKLDTYTFKQDYYYMIGDNRHSSADSRMWGFVPADHIVGKTLIVFMSKDQEKGWFDGGIRWNRIFKTF